jgi:hypothetical protein
MSYFNVRQIFFHHRVEERDISATLHDDDKVAMEADYRDDAMVLL